MAKKKIFHISNALTEGLEETIAAANQFSGELRIDVIPLKRIEVDPSNPRDLKLEFLDIQEGIKPNDPHGEQKLKEREGLQSLAESIKGQGIINPIVVYKYGNKYRLIAGERRTLASMIAGKNEIQAKILDGKPSALNISLLQWIENVERSDLSLWERLTNLEKIILAFRGNKNTAIDKITISDIAKLLGCTKPHALNYRSVLMADEDLKSLIRENKIKNLEKAAFIANISDKEIKNNVINACLMGSPLRKLKILLREDHKVKSLKKHNKIERRGRQSNKINFGYTKNLKVAKSILLILLRNQELSFLNKHIQDVSFDDYKSVTNTFKMVLTKLEEIHA